MADHSLLMRMLPRGMAARRARDVVREILFKTGVGATAAVSDAVRRRVSSGLFALIVSRLERLLQIHSLRLSARADRVREARRCVAAALGVDHPCVDAATEAVSELVTNAILYGSRDERATVILRVRLLSRRRVRLTVRDEGGTGHVPAIGRPDADAVKGRGLLIVSALACRLYWARQGSGHKVVALLDPLRSGPKLAGPASIDLGTQERRPFRCV
jgi:anti-sigma regulatory factor (Ser/Thr protein kinase)